MQRVHEHVGAVGAGIDADGADLFVDDERSNDQGDSLVGLAGDLNRKAVHSEADYGGAPAIIGR